MDHILKAILHAPPSEWSAYFEQFRQMQYKQIPSATPDKLMEIQQYVKGLNFIENIFKNVHDTKKLT